MTGHPRHVGSASERCTACQTPIALTLSWTIWPWPDGARLCDTCNDERHEHDDYDDVARAVALRAAERHLVFVYGTLRPSLYPDVLARFNVRALPGPAVLFGAWRMFSLGMFPAIVSVPLDVVAGPDPGRAQTGELIEADGHALAQLDRYEGYPRLYDRMTVSIVRPDIDGDGRAVQAFVYVMRDAPAAATIVASGDWADVVRAARRDGELTDG